MMRLKGSITVFISIILAILIAFCGVVVDLSRFRLGEKHARAAVQLSVQSALTQYNAPLKENYGIWVLGKSEDELEALIYDLIEKNLCVENKYMPGIVDLYGFSVEKVSVEQMFNITDENVLEQQITDYMKYRAPVIAVGIFIEKLKSLTISMAQSGLVNKKMDLENKLQKIREEQVYLSLLLSERVSKYSNNGKPNAELINCLDLISKSYDEIEDFEKVESNLDVQWARIEPLVKVLSQEQIKINEKEAEISALKPQLSSLEKDSKYIEDEIDSYESDIKDLEKQIEKLEKKISNEEEKDKPNLSSISSYKQRINDLDSSITRKERSISSLNNDHNAIENTISTLEGDISSIEEQINNIKNSIKEEEKELQKRINYCVANFEEIEQRMELIKEKIREIEIILCMYIQYHEESQKLISNIINQSQEISKISEQIDSEIKRQSENSDNSFLVRMKADIKKLTLNISSDVLIAVKADIDSNLSLLNELYGIVQNTKMHIYQALNSIEEMIETTIQIPKTLEFSKRELFSPKLKMPVERENDEVSQSALTYSVSVYNIEPSINNKEKDAFKRWCNKKFNENNKTTGKDKGAEKKLRNNINKADEKEKEEYTKSYNGKDIGKSNKELDHIFQSLPSYIGKTEQSKNSDKGNSDAEQSYKNSLNKNGNMAKVIGGILSDNSQALLKSLYVNEFIIGSFKNTNIDTVQTKKISLQGRAEKTFYEKAEVEYVIFGAKKENVNANLAQTSIFGIRMGLNTIHVYTSTDKTAAALTAATSISGWTGFGVPIVKNLILIGWAAGESFLDVKDINSGKDVPIYKTDNTWKLSLKKLFTGIVGEFLDESSQMLKEKKDEVIDKADDAIQTLINDIVASAVNEAFLPLEQEITELGSETDFADSALLTDIGTLSDINDIDELKAWIKNACVKQYNSIKRDVSDWTIIKLEDYKRQITTKLIDFIFSSPYYRDIVSTLKESLNNAIDQGVDYISESFKDIGDSIEDPGMQSQLVGTITSFDYTDYLRLLLFTVPQKTKLLRTADLMQLNMQETLEDPNYNISDYSTFLIVEADISMKCMFIPSHLKNDEIGTIKIKWGYGY